MQSDQIAKFAHRLVCEAPIRGGDAENVVVVKAWLTQIANGELIVGKAAPEPAATTPEENQ